MASARPILLLELNEVHWPVLDRMRVGRPSIAAFLDGACGLTTMADTRARLSPWITWPTLHRGLSPEAHGMMQLGQDPTTGHGTPIWEEVRARGGSIGVVGSLHSWPPIDPGPDGFFVPDTFASSPACFPRSLEPLQAMNLALVRESGRVASTAVPWARALAAAPLALRLRLSPRLAVRAVGQLARERVDRDRRDARPIVQAALFWAVFRRLSAARAPAFASFFTNHVASLLHRHWADLFPSSAPPGHMARPAHRAMLEASFDLVDEMLRDAMRMARERPELIVVLASSMGQGGVTRAGHHGRELAITDVARLLEAVGVARSEHRPGIAMVPQATTTVQDDSVAARIREGLHALRTPVSSRRVLDVVIRGRSVSIQLATPWREDVAEGVLIAPGGARLSFDALGLVAHDVEAGTGYHVPEGALAIVGRGIPADASRREVPLADVKSMLLDLAGLA